MTQVTTVAQLHDQVKIIRSALQIYQSNDIGALNLGEKSDFILKVIKLAII